MLTKEDTQTERDRLPPVDLEISLSASLSLMLAHTFTLNSSLNSIPQTICVVGEGWMEKARRN